MDLSLCPAHNSGGRLRHSPSLALLPVVTDLEKHPGSTGQDREGRVRGAQPAPGRAENADVLPRLLGLLSVV